MLRITKIQRARPETWRIYTKLRENQTGETSQEIKRDEISLSMREGRASNASGTKAGKHQL
jgi:hypothetical protein